MLKNDQNHSETVFIDHLTRPKAIKVTGLLISVFYNAHKMYEKFWSPIVKIKGDMGMSTIFEASEYPRIVDKCVKMRNIEKTVLLSI